MRHGLVKIGGRTPRHILYACKGVQAVGDGASTGWTRAARGHTPIGSAGSKILLRWFRCRAATTSEHRRSGVHGIAFETIRLGRARHQGCRQLLKRRAVERTRFTLRHGTDTQREANTRPVPGECGRVVTRLVRWSAVWPDVEAHPSDVGAQSERVETGLREELLLTSAGLVVDL